MTKALTVEALFAEIETENVIAKIAVAITRKGSVKHDREVAEAASEYAEDYWPGVRVIVEVFE